MVGSPEASSRIQYSPRSPAARTDAAEEGASVPCLRCLSRAVQYCSIDLPSFRQAIRCPPRRGGNREGRGRHPTQRTGHRSGGPGQWTPHGEQNGTRQRAHRRHRRAPTPTAARSMSPHAQPVRLWMWPGSRPGWGTRGALKSIGSARSRSCSSVGLWAVQRWGAEVCSTHIRRPHLKPGQFRLIGRMWKPCALAALHLQEPGRGEFSHAIAGRCGPTARPMHQNGPRTRRNAKSPRGRLGLQGWICCVVWCVCVVARVGVRACVCVCV